MTDFEMTLTDKYTKRYMRADQTAKSQMLDEYTRLSGVSRNTAVQRLRRKWQKRHVQTVPSQNQPRGRPRTYQQPHRLLVKQANQLVGPVCAERLHPVLGDCLEALKQARQLTGFDQSVVSQVKAISLGSLKRLVGPLPTAKPSRSPRANDVLRQVAIQPYFGQFAKQAGYVALDYVEHSGGDSRGRFVQSGTYVELNSQWLGRAAGWGKNRASVEEIHQLVTRQWPLPVVHFHTDNVVGTLGYLLEQVTLNQQVSRSRPYRKNDNAHVEQKNGDKVRKLIGYGRLDTAEAVEALNALYWVEDLLTNYFSPSAKLQEKIYRSDGKLEKKVYDTPQTPYQRVMAGDGYSDQLKGKLNQDKASLDLVDLRAQSEQLKGQLQAHFSYPLR